LDWVSDIRNNIGKALMTSDRASRSEYWRFAACCFLFGLVSNSFTFDLLFEGRAIAPEPTIGIKEVLSILVYTAIAIASAFVYLVLLIALFSAGIRRCNDLSLSNNAMGTNMWRFAQVLSPVPLKSVASFWSASMVLILYPLVSLGAARLFLGPSPASLTVSFAAAFQLTLVLIVASLPLIVLAKRSNEHENKHGPNPNEVST
jgi:uncharacterized membrane protein YhaH (DUF805 family)